MNATQPPPAGAEVVPLFARRTVARLAGTVPKNQKVGTAPQAHETSPFDQLTARLILDQHRRGVLPEAVLLALLQAATGLRP